MAKRPSNVTQWSTDMGAIVPGQGRYPEPIKRSFETISDFIDYVTVDDGTGNNDVIDGDKVLFSTPFPVSGIVVPYAGASAPDGWMICDGTAISRTTYADLFAVIGITYGSGDGVNTFNLPNLAGKVIVAKDSNDATFDTLGETGGEKTHQLTKEELPSLAFAGSSDAVQAASGTSGHWAIDANMTINGSGTPHNNLQPFMVMNYIIKY